MCQIFYMKFQTYVLETLIGLEVLSLRKTVHFTAEKLQSV